jgi:hypothetical protein
MSNRSAPLAAAGTVLLWASAFPAITVAVRGLGPAGLAVARLGVASAVLALAAPWLGGRGKAGLTGMRRPSSPCRTGSGSARCLWQTGR